MGIRMHKSSNDCFHSASTRKCFISLFFGALDSQAKRNEPCFPAHSSHALKGASTAMCDKRSNSTLRERRPSTLSGAESHLAAERELAAFYNAVLKMHGPAEAQRAAEEWIEEVERPAAGMPSDLRHATVRAAHALALRVAPQRG